MSEELVQIGSQKAIQNVTAGIGNRLSTSRLFKPKPVHININQRMTEAEGAVPGKLRISETGEQFDSIEVVLLDLPGEGRDYYIGEKGKLNRKPENLMCFSRDMVFPHKNAKAPQAMKCDGCKQGDWTKWRQTKAVDDIPPCDPFYLAKFASTAMKIPINFYIRGGANKAAFEKLCAQIGRKITLLQAEGKNPELYDIAFKLEAEKNPKKPTTYIIKEIKDLKSFRIIEKEEDRAKFGEIFAAITENYQKQQTPAQQEQEAQNNASDAVDAAVNATGPATLDSQPVPDSSNAVDGTYEEEIPF